MPFSIRVLGSGTSSGVPTIGCGCEVCRSSDPRDRRLRPSILIRTSDADGGGNIVIDTTPDFRAQMLAAGIARLDGIVYTHSHADHILGLDDVRPFDYRQGSIPLFAFPETFSVIRRVFSYAFDQREVKTHVPRLDVKLLDRSGFELCGIQFQPVPVMHGSEEIHGFRFGRAAYLTDHSHIPDASFDLLKDLDVLFLDALRHREHPTHSTLRHATELAQRIRARRTYFTHMCHDLPHAATEAGLPEGVFLAYDGLEIDVP